MSPPPSPSHLQTLLIIITINEPLKGLHYKIIEVESSLILVLGIFNPFLHLLHCSLGWVYIRVHVQELGVHNTSSPCFRIRYWIEMGRLVFQIRRGSFLQWGAELANIWHGNEVTLVPLQSFEVHLTPQSTSNCYRHTYIVNHVLIVDGWKVHVDLTIPSCHWSRLES